MGIYCVMYNIFSTSIFYRPPPSDPFSRLIPGYDDYDEEPYPPFQQVYDWMDGMMDGWIHLSKSFRDVYCTQLPI